MLQQNVILTGKPGFNWFKLVFFGSVRSMLSQQPVAHFWGKNRIGPDLKTLFLFRKVVTCELQIIEVSMWPMFFLKKPKKAAASILKGFSKSKKVAAIKGNHLRIAQMISFYGRFQKAATPILKVFSEKQKKQLHQS